MLEITDVRLFKVRKQGNVVCTASITFENSIAVHNIKVVEGANGLFIAMPSRRIGGVYKDLIHPINKETRERLQKAIIDEYLTKKDILNNSLV